MDGYLPLRTPSRVSVITPRGKFEAMVIEAWGNAGGYTERRHLRDKFRTIAQRQMTEDQAERMITAVDNLRTGRVDTLLDLLAQPLLPV
jgi:uncharacterized membrane protein